MNSILRHGGLASFGTDWPAAGYDSTFRPLDAIEVATTRRELDRPHGPPLPPIDEAITLDAALKASPNGAGHRAVHVHRRARRIPMNIVIAITPHDRERLGGVLRLRPSERGNAVGDGLHAGQGRRAG